MNELNFYRFKDVYAEELLFEIKQYQVIKPKSFSWAKNKVMLSNYASSVTYGFRYGYTIIQNPIIKRVCSRLKLECTKKSIRKYLGFN
jgi:hypothetical protein